MAGSCENCKYYAPVYAEYARKLVMSCTNENVTKEMGNCTFFTRRDERRCEHCKWLDLTDKTSVGYRCRRPNHYWRYKTSCRKYKWTRACKAFAERGDT